MRKIYGTTEKQAATVRYIKKLRNVHHGRRRSYRKIAELLNGKLTDHIPPAGSVWHSSTVRVLSMRAADADRRRVKKVGLSGDGYLSVRQAAMVFAVAWGQYSDSRSRRVRRRAAVVLVLMLTGIRRGELVKLKYRDLPICHGKDEISVLGKGNKRATVQLSKFTRRLLDEIARQRGMRSSDGSYLFLSESGKRYDPKSVYELVRGFGRSVDLQFLRPHVLRHTYASILLWDGADIGYVRNQLRHANIATTDIYTQVISETLSDNPPEHVVLFLNAINPKRQANTDKI